MVLFLFFKFHGDSTVQFFSWEDVLEHLPRFIKHFMLLENRGDI